MKWIASHPELPAFYQWQDEVVVYDPVASDTHLLSLAAWACLKAVMNKALSTSEIYELLANEFKMGKNQDLMTYIDATMRELKALMLVDEKWA